MKNQDSASSRIPPIETLLHVPVSPSYSTLYLARFHQKQQRKKLFVIGNMEIRDERLSPNQQFYYLVGDRTYVGKIGQSKFQTLSNRLYRCLFSPNSRYLLGRLLGGRGSLMLFDYRNQKQKILSEEECAPYVGWYPDNRHIWYIVGEIKETNYYLQDIQAARVQRLKPAEARHIHTDWEMLDPRFRISHTDLQGLKAYAYAKDGRIRVKVEPYDPLARERAAGASQVFLEWKNGRSQRLIKAGSHAWEEVHPQDVSADGKWVLLICGVWKKKGNDEITPEFNLVVIETQTGKRLYPFQGQKEPSLKVGQPTPLVPIYWFGKP